MLIHTKKVFDAVTIVKNTSQKSDAIDLNQMDLDGTYSLQFTITGDGTVTLKYEVSNDGTTFVTPTGAADIKAGMTKTGGPGGDGKEQLAFVPVLGRFMKISAAETANAHNAIITAVLAMR